MILLMRAFSFYNYFSLSLGREFVGMRSPRKKGSIATILKIKRNACEHVQVRTVFEQNFK